MKALRHLLSMDDLDRDDIDYLLDLTQRYVEVGERKIPRIPALRGKTVALVFYEDSTRTRISFATAASRLSADALGFDVKRSSANKGESLRDTVETISAMGVHGIVLRHFGAGAPWRVREWTDASVINGGDGRNQHPTQSLADLFTARRHLGELDGKQVAIVGDVKNSRVARSNAIGFAEMGAEVVFVAPQTLLPASLEGWPVSATHNLDEVVDEIDVCYLLRMQLERQHDAPVPTLREFHHEFGLTAARADRLKDGALIMHPGPMNRGVEIAGEVADRPNAVITEQVANGVAVRMAVLFVLIGSRLDLVEESSLADLESAVA
ncbi:MAG: aspartate carbamoyltransferase catalytic subunit [Acidimicrobiaceae bacterium]|nr:aspartate carbamoyltransferase catalytic subunit [Acidimicrobiaceae bacterium]